MELSNDKIASRAKILLISIPFILLVVTIIPALFLLIHTWIPAIVSGGLVILGWSATVAMRLMNVKFRFEPESFSVFYYPISPMTSSYRRIDLTAGKLSRFEIRVSPGGLRKDLILYENIGGQDASYPPVSVRLCGKEDLRIIEEYLNAYCFSGTSS